MSSVELKGFKGLRGLDNLAIDTSSQPSVNEKIEKLPVGSLLPGKYQPRKRINESVLNELAESIKSQGIIQPLIVRKVDVNQYEIIAGERRWRAAQLAGLTHVPVIVRQVEDNIAFAFAMIENIQREDLNPIEEALAFARFRDEFSMKHEEIAQLVGRSRVAVTNCLRLLMLEPEVRGLLEEGQLDMGHARALLALDSARQVEVAFLIVEKQLNVRETEKLVQSFKKATDLDNKAQSLPRYNDRCQTWSELLSQKLSSRVLVKLNNKGSGKIVIQVDSPKEVDWLLEHMEISG